MTQNILLGVAASAAMMLTGSAEPAIGPQVQAALQQRLPKTPITGIDCTKIEGLCEVTAGANLFYVDKSARYLVIGRVYDMETRQDLWPCWPSALVDEGTNLSLVSLLLVPPVM